MTYWLAPHAWQVATGPPAGRWDGRLRVLGLWPDDDLARARQRTGSSPSPGRSAQGPTRRSGDDHLHSEGEAEVGELAGLGYLVSASSVRRVLRANGLDPVPRRVATTWSSFIRKQASAIVACDFFTVDSVWLTRYYVLFFIEIESRRVHACGITTSPSGERVTQQARNLVTELEDAGRVVAHLIRDRDAKFTHAFADVWRSVGAEIVRTPVRAPNANAFAERWIGSARRECLDHVLIVGPRHLRRVLPAYVEHYNTHRPHRSLGLLPPTQRSGSPERLLHTRGHISRRDVLGGLIDEYDLVA